MSARLRAAGEALRAKYSRVLGVPVDLVEAMVTEDGDVIVSHREDPSFPSWSLGSSNKEQR